MKKQSQDRLLTDMKIEEIMGEENPNEIEKRRIFISQNWLRKILFYYIIVIDKIKYKFFISKDI